jgi:hypothetical protein
MKHECGGFESHLLCPASGSLTCSFAEGDHCGATVGPHLGGSAGLQGRGSGRLQAAGELVEFVGEQVAVCVQGDAGRRVA